MSNFHATFAIDDALAAIGRRSIVFSTEMAGLLEVIQARLTDSVEDMAADVELDLKLEEVTNFEARAKAHAAGVADSVVPTSKMIDFLLDLRGMVSN